MAHKIFLVGGTGGVGKLFLEMALEQGHEIVLYARNPRKIEIDHPNLTMVKGELNDFQAIRAGVKGCDVCLITVGVMNRKPNTILSDGTRNLITAAKEEGIKRFIAVTSIGLGDSKDQAMKAFTYFVVPLIIKHSFADKELQEKIIMESDLDWIIIRPGSLTNRGRTGVYRHGRDKSIKGRISRADVADFLLTQLDDNCYLHQAICITY